MCRAIKSEATKTAKYSGQKSQEKAHLHIVSSDDELRRGHAFHGNNHTDCERSSELVNRAQI